MELGIPDQFIVRECSVCHTEHAPIRDCPSLDSQTWHMGTMGGLGFCARTDDHAVSECDTDLDPDFWPNDDLEE